MMSNDHEDWDRDWDDGRRVNVRDPEPPGPPSMSSSSGQGQVGGGGGGGGGSSAKKKKKNNGKKNAFQCYMEHIKRGLEAKGQKFSNGLTDLVAIANETWPNMNPVQRAPYEKLAAESRGKVYKGPSADTNSEMTHHPDPEGGQGRGRTGGETGSQNHTSSPVTSQPQQQQRSMPAGLVPAPGTTLTEVTDVEAQKRKVVEMGELLRVLDPCVAAIPDVRFIIINANLYCRKDDGDIVPSEIGLTAFCVLNGMLDNYATLIDPGEVPVGYALDVERNCEKFQLPRPSFDPVCQDYNQIMNDIIKFVNMYPTSTPGIGLMDHDYVFCLRSEMEVVKGTLDWLKIQTGIEKNFQIRSLDILIQLLCHLGKQNWERWVRLLGEEGGTRPWSSNLVPPPVIINQVPFTIADDDNDRSRHFRSLSEYRHLKPMRLFKVGARAVVKKHFPIIRIPYEGQTGYLDNENPVFVYEEQVADYFNCKDFAFDPSLACPHHMIHNRSVKHCSLNKVNRYMFTALDLLVGFFLVAPMEGHHYPFKNRTIEERRRRSHLRLWNKA